MPVTEHTLKFDFADIAGDPLDPRHTVAWVETNAAGGVVVDTNTGGKVLAGSKFIINKDLRATAGTIDLPSTAGATNPTDFQYRVWPEYRTVIDGRTARRQWSSGWFSFTAAADLKDVIAEQYVPPTYVSQATAALDAHAAELEGDLSAYSTAAAGSATAADQARVGAEAARDDAVGLVTSDLGTTDGQTRALIEDPDSQTATALSATIAGDVADPASQIGGALNTAFAAKTQTHTLIVDPGGSGTHTTIAAALAAATTGTRILLKQDPASLVASHFPADSLLLPNVDGVTIEGWGLSVAGITFPAGKGFYFDGTRNNRGWHFKNLYISASGGTLTGNGFDLTNATTGRFDNVRISGYNRGINGLGVLDSHHWVLDNCRITNCNTGIYARADVNGCNNWRVIGGEYSSNGIGIDSDCGAWHIDHPSFESNTTVAVKWSGTSSRLILGRLEGNTQDISLEAASNRNTVWAPMLSLSKFVDNSTAKTNTVNAGTTSTGASISRAPLQTIDSRLAGGAITVPAANTAMFSRVYPERVMKVSSISFVPIVSAGNVDVSIWGSYDASAPITSSGSTAVGTAGQVQTINLPSAVYLHPTVPYDIGIVFSDGTVQVLGFAGTLVEQGRANMLDRASLQKASMFPFAGKNLNSATNYAATPWLRLA